MLTNRERYELIFKGEIPDRPAVKLWGLEPEQALLHPAYEPVYKKGMELTDIMPASDSPFDLFCGCAKEDITQVTEEPAGSDEWVNVVTVINTPAGSLKSIFAKSTLGNPGYDKEYLIKEPDDLEKLLSAPYRPYPFSDKEFLKKEHIIGGRGKTKFRLDNPVYGIHRLMGSELFALWSIEYRDLLLNVMKTFSRRIHEHAKHALEAGINLISWVGPEVCIPPLMSPVDFEDFVLSFDKPLIDLIHDSGGYVWVHCHGKMGPVIERFADMGVDVLNPVEPPPMGDITLPEAFERIGDRMGLEGNIETHDIMTAPREKMIALIHEALEVGRDRRFILCPSSGYMEWPEPAERLIENLLIFITEGVRLAGS